MVPLLSTDRALEISTEGQRWLLRLARAAITRQFDPRLSLPEIKCDAEGWNQPAACFVTLRTVDGQHLRGCIGTLEAQRPLAQAVAYFAEQAALHDARFAPLTQGELSTTEIEISVLSPLTALQVHSESELLQRLLPGTDGLSLQAGEHRATFLPQVWRQLPGPHQFVTQLKRKAGLSPDSWGDDYCWWRYRVVCFSEAD